MPSVVGLLEQHELAARRRVDGLREEADRIQAELAAAELEWQEWAIARRRVDTVLAPDDGASAGAEVTPDPRDGEVQSALRDAAKPKSQVPVWRQGLAWSLLSVDYQRILKALADRAKAPSRAADLPGDGRHVRYGRGAGAGGSTAVEGETPGGPRLAGRAAAGPVLPRCGCGRARRWIVERLFAHLMRSHRLVRDFERRTTRTAVLVSSPVTTLAA
jgi:hypothetical protein